jgi:transcriptional regulator with XRE-family HTH domain
MKNCLKKLRKLRGWSQRHLAKRIGTTHDTISRLERDERPLSASWIERLARGLECDPVMLLGGEMVTDNERDWLHCFRLMSPAEQTRWLRTIQEFTSRDPIAPKSVRERA